VKFMAARGLTHGVHTRATLAVKISTTAEMFLV